MSCSARSSHPNSPARRRLELSPHGSWRRSALGRCLTTVGVPAETRSCRSGLTTAGSRARFSTPAGASAPTDDAAARKQHERGHRQRRTGIERHPGDTNGGYGHQSSKDRSDSGIREKPGHGGDEPDRQGPAPAWPAAAASQPDNRRETCHKESPACASLHHK
jgi:hypothetical protein